MVTYTLLYYRETGDNGEKEYVVLVAAEPAEARKESWRWSNPGFYLHSAYEVSPCADSGLISLPIHRVLSAERKENKGA
jgi:hypothetical protein